MVKWLMKRGIAAFERQWNYDASYVHEIIEASPRAAWMFSRAAAIGKYRKDVPLAAWAAAALNVIEGAERVAAFLAGVVRKGWTEDMTVRFDTINGLPGLIMGGPNGLVQTTAFEIEGDVVKAIYVVRNPDKLGHLASI